jgi:hypothetical protein
VSELNREKWPESYILYVRPGVVGTTAVVVSDASAAPPATRMSAATRAARTTRAIQDMGMEQVLQPFCAFIGGGSCVPDRAS